ncbi:MAG TPA: PIN domain-containing protein [Symbiobacteriaceae bacterium]|nr:PIN domain-containing protein [Symbiobacteriaceae bacterium]
MLNEIPVVGQMLSILTAVVSGYLGLAVATFKREEAAHWLASLAQRGNKVEGGAREDVLSSFGAKGSPKVLDTSVIIDGRIKEILETGFLEGPIIVPSFVLDELRHISDSADLLRRNRGRRGLDILNAIQKDPEIEVRIHEERVSEGMEVDTQLLKVAKRMGGKVVTNDYNLNKVAEFQGVPVLNINELANSVKPAVLPGEEMTVQVIKEGKEIGQGVGYLDDGTMIVVDGGKRFLGETIGVVVTSVLQTAAGRMIFAKPRVATEKVAP